MKLCRLSLAVGLLAFSSVSHAAITGTTFSDGNGVKDVGDSGVPEIIINAYDATETLVGSAVSGAETLIALLLRRPSN